LASRTALVETLDLLLVRCFVTKTKNAAENENSQESFGVTLISSINQRRWPTHLSGSSDGHSTNKTWCRSNFRQSYQPL